MFANPNCPDLVTLWTVRSMTWFFRFSEAMDLKTGTSEGRGTPPGTTDGLRTLLLGWLLCLAISTSPLASAATVHRIPKWPLLWNILGKGGYWRGGFEAKSPSFSWRGLMFGSLSPYQVWFTTTRDSNFRGVWCYLPLWAFVYTYFLQHTHM